MSFKRIYFDDSFYVPDLAFNLLSAQRLGPADIHGKWRFSKVKGARLVDKDLNVLLQGKWDPVKRLWTTTEEPVRVSTPIHIALQAKEESNKAAHRLLGWHRRLGHIDMKRVWDLGREGRLDGKKWKEGFERVECIGCLKGKATRSASASNNERASRPLVNVSVDLWGPATTKSRLGYYYFLTCYDDHSRYIYTAPLKSKDEAFDAIVKYTNLAETQLERQIKTIRSDQGGEFTSNKFRDWCSNKGIEHDFTPTAAHNQNSRIERVHLTLLNDVRTALADSRLSNIFWADALAHSVYTRNRLPNKSGTTPYMLFKAENQHQTINYSHLQAFGTKCVYRVVNQESKLDPRGELGTIIGYGMGTTSYTILTKDKRVIVSRDVTFIDDDESSPWSPTDADTQHEPFVITNESNRGESAPPDNQMDEKPIEEDDEVDLAPPVVMVPRRQQMDHVEIPARRLVQLNAERNEPGGVVRRSGRLQGLAPENYVPLEGAPGDESEEEEEEDALAVGLHHALSAQNLLNPQSYQQARNSGEWHKWKEAMDEEMGKMEKYDVWEVVWRTNQRTLTGKWVYTRKIDGDSGRPSAYKARFVVRGFQQIAGRDFDELFASVAHRPSLRVFLSIVNYMDWECDQMDVIGAFLKGDIDRDLYVELPEGSDIPADHVLHLKKSLYGLKQSPHLFNKKIDEFLRSLDFTPCKADPCIYSFNKNGTRFMISIHVDDLLIAGNDRTKLNELKRKLNDELECKDQGQVSYFLGINIHRDRANRKLYLSQEHYLESLLERFGEVGKPCKTILPSDWKPIAATDEEFAQAKDKPFPALAGSILYAATITRPDIAYAASLLCRFIGKWSLDHWKGAKHLLRYLRGTSDLSLVFDATAGKRALLGWADADWGGCLDTRRSTTGYVFSTYGGVVSWKSRRQPTVALSTTQAELLASTEAGKEAVWLRQLLADLELGPADGEPVVIYNDNSGAIQLASTLR